MSSFMLSQSLSHLSPSLIPSRYRISLQGYISSALNLRLWLQILAVAFQKKIGLKFRTQKIAPKVIRRVLGLRASASSNKRQARC